MLVSAFRATRISIADIDVAYLLNNHFLHCLLFTNKNWWWWNRADLRGARSAVDCRDCCRAAVPGCRTENRSDQQTSPHMQKHLSSPPHFTVCLQLGPSYHHQAVRAVVPARPHHTRLVVLPQRAGPGPDRRVARAEQYLLPAVHVCIRNYQNWIYSSVWTTRSVRRGAGCRPPTDRITNSITGSAGGARRGAAAPLRHPPHSHTAAGHSVQPIKHNNQVIITEGCS